MNFSIRAFSTTHTASLISIFICFHLPTKFTAHLPYWTLAPNTHPLCTCLTNHLSSFTHRSSRLCKQ